MCALPSFMDQTDGEGEGCGVRRWAFGHSVARDRTARTCRTRQTSEQRTPNPGRHTAASSTRLAPLPERVDRAIDAELRGEGRAAHLPGDLGHGAVFVVSQAQDSAVALGQRLNQSIDGAALLVP